MQYDSFLVWCGGYSDGEYYYGIYLDRVRAAVQDFRTSYGMGCTHRNISPPAPAGAERPAEVADWLGAIMSRPELFGLARMWTRSMVSGADIRAVALAGFPADMMYPPRKGVVVEMYAGPATGDRCGATMSILRHDGALIASRQQGKVVLHVAADVAAAIVEQVSAAAPQDER